MTVPERIPVDSAKSKATFVDAELTLRGGAQDRATLHPWGQAGLRHQLDGESTEASAGFVGNVARFSLPGAARSETVATVGAGIGVDISRSARLDIAYRGEFGGGTGTQVGVGVDVAF